MNNLFYRRLEWASFTLLLIIAIAIALLFSEHISLKVFKISLAVLLLIALGLFIVLRQALTDTITTGKKRFKSAEYKFDKLFESNVIGILISSQEGVVLDANDAFLKMVGYSQADLADSKIRWDHVITPESKVETDSALKRLEKEGYYKPFEKHLERKDGTKFWALCGSSALYDKKEGDIVSYIIDITQRKDAQEKAIEYEQIINTQQEEFKAVFMNAPAYITIRRGPELRYVFVNKAISAISRNYNLLGKTNEEVFAETNREQDALVARRVFETGEPVKGTAYKLDYINDAGEPQAIYLDYMLTPVFDHNGKVDGVAFFGNDVTELITANQEMELSKDKFSFLADTMPHKVWITNAEGHLQYLNKAWLEYAAIKSIEDEGGKWLDVRHPDEIDMTVNAWNEARAQGTEYLLESRFRRVDGEYRWHQTYAVPFKDAYGQIVYWVGINTDIHDQRVQLQHLQDNEAYFRNLSEETPFIVWRSDRVGKCVYLNKKWTEFTGLSIEESLGNGYRKAMLIDDFEAYRQKWIETLRTHSLYQGKFQLRGADGTYRWFFSQANPHYVNSVFEGYVGSIVDITDQELSTRAIKELSEKKDEFLSIASHELKTPLTSIKASIQLIARAISTDHKISPFAVKASEQLLRLERLIADLLDVSKINSGKLVYNNTVFYFKEMLREVVQSIQQTTSTHKIVIEQSDKVILLGDRFRLEQVLYNFLSNAIKYSPEADRVIVSSRVKDNNLVVSIQDFGIGISSENLSKAFDRYYRVDDTAMRFQGLGLGLFISAEILKRHNGSYWIESEPGKGSTFFFSLPLNDTSHLVKPETDGRTFYKDGRVEIRYQAANHFLETNWHGFQNLETIKMGCLEMLHLLEVNSCNKVLNDNTHLLGNWGLASEWGSKVWLPAMEKAGLRYFAWIHSESTFSRLAANKITRYSTDLLVTRFFDHREEAIAWLDHVDEFDAPENISPESNAAELI